MAATEALMEGGHATFEKNVEKVSFELEPQAVGLTKEQLEQYRNDPFWKPVRMVLFAAFWLAWLAMFAGAIAIVVLSPKCAERQKPDWWQTKTSYQILTATFFDTDGDAVGDFNGITEKLDQLKKIGVTTVYPAPVVQIERNEYFDTHSVMDHLSVDPRFGKQEDFEKLISAAHDRGMYVVMDLPISSVSNNHAWFKSGDASLFVTAKVGDKAYSRPDYYFFPGLNGTKYRSYPKRENPVLNWQNKQVKDTITDAVKKFLLLGVDGFHIDHVSQLALNADGETDHDKSIASLQELTTAINEFIASKDELKEKKIVLFSSLRDIEALETPAKDIGNLHYVIDTSFAKLTPQKCTDGMAQCVHNALTAAYDKMEPGKYTPYWQFSNADSSRLNSRFDDSTANLLTFMQLTLPGALSLYYGQELSLKDTKTVLPHLPQHGIMQWTPKGDLHHGFVTKNIEGNLFFEESDDETDGDNFDTQYGIELSPLKVYQKLAKLRQRDEALIVGETHRDAIVQDVILYSRYVTNNGTVTGAVYVVALNFGDKDQNVELFSLPNTIPKEKSLANAEVAAITVGISDYRARQKVDFSNTALVLPAKQGVLLRL